MKQWIHDIWREYRSEVIFGLVMSVLLFASTFLSRLISEDFFDSFLNPALSFAFAIVCFFGAAMCFRHLDNNRIRKTWAVILILWGLWELVMVALYPIWMMRVVFRNIRKYRRWCEENFSTLDDIDAQWIVRYMVMIVLAGLVFYYLCVSDDPARAFTQQWYLMFVLGYTTDQVLYRPDPWERLRSTAVEEEKEDEPDPVNAAYRATLEAWIEKEKPYLSPDFQLMDLRQVLPMNRTYLSQFINAEYGCSFYHWVNSLRIAEAKRLLTEHPEIKMKEIAQQSGFSSPTVFSRVFIRETGMTPKQVV